MQLDIHVRSHHIPYAVLASKLILGFLATYVATTYQVAMLVEPLSFTRDPVIALLSSANNYSICHKYKLTRTPTAPLQQPSVNAIWGYQQNGDPVPKSLVCWAPLQKNGDPLS